jgi:hypothetical protein
LMSLSNNSVYKYIDKNNSGFRLNFCDRMAKQQKVKYVPPRNTSLRHNKAHTHIHTPHTIYVSLTYIHSFKYSHTTLSTSLSLTHTLSNTHAISPSRSLTHTLSIIQLSFNLCNEIKLPIFNVLTLQSVEHPVMASLLGFTAKNAQKMIDYFVNTSYIDTNL